MSKKVPEIFQRNRLLVQIKFKLHWSPELITHTAPFGMEIIEEEDAMKFMEHGLQRNSTQIAFLLPPNF
jgi:hypothetical protein